jgi:hypothetical protein
MTREEAISAMGFLKESVFTSYAEEALDMAIAALREQPRWISVKDRLPVEADANPYESILAIEKDDGFARAWCWDIVVRYPNEFTHWMPLPEPPEVSHG